MQKAELIQPKESRIQNAPAVRQGNGLESASPGGAQMTQLATSINSSPGVIRQRVLADLIHSGPRQTAQRKLIDEIQSSRRQGAATRMKSGAPPQGKHESAQPTHDVPSLAADSPAQLLQRPAARSNNTGLPDTLKSGVESLSGISMDNVRVHYNSSNPAQLNALAYAQGTDIHVSPGQEKHLPHEAWHVVQQAQGRVRPTMQMKGRVNINDDAGLENEADAMGAKALQFSNKDGGNSSLAPAVEAGCQLAQDVQNLNQYKLSPVAQLVSWTESKVERYKRHLRRRAATRRKKGKNKNTNKLLWRYMYARWAANPSWVPRLADAPKAGHHVPPLAVSNNQKGVFAYGTRGSEKEKRRKRLFLHGTKEKRRMQHWMMHEAEGMQGINRNGEYDGNSKDLARGMGLAHHGLIGPDGNRLTAEVLSQHDRENGGSKSQVELGDATKEVLEEHAPGDMGDVESDDMSSSPESDEDAWKTDSDDDSDSDSD